MKKSTYATLALISLFLFSTACSNSKKSTEESSSPTFNVDDLLSAADSLTGQIVSVEGVCTHICKHGGKKIFLMGTDDTQTLRIEATDATGAFSQECVNALVKVTGKLIEQRVDEAYLQQWEEQTKIKTEQHGSGKTTCTAEQKAKGESNASGTEQRIAAFRKRITEQEVLNGKNYLSFYHLEAESYKIIE